MDEKKTEVKPMVRQRLCVYRKLDENDDAFIEKEVRAFRPLYVIARSLGCDRRTLSSYIKKRFPDLLSEMRESMLDIAEAKLLQNINSGNENSIEYFLDRQGKDRGYGNQVAIPQSAVPVINIGRIDVRKEEVLEVKQ